MRAARATAWVLTIGGLLGLLGALTLTIERIMLLEDSAYVPSCNLNPVLSCGSVMTTEQAALFGFPNPIIGIVAFTVVLMTGILTLGRIELPHWYWLGLSTGTALGVVFVHWLIYQSLYEIHALCPYCMVVWAVTMPIFIVSLSQLVDRDRDRAGNITRALLEWRWTILAVWYAIVIAAIGIEFSDYWSTLV
ncbi:vitamin K epoxide reductase family protein [Rhodococcus sp. PAMC28707]|uniref:vitamin K epoxide reductase family protein n=1 Tax=unclassified Rhodococcus (in: high G+C Gram-positive bacteria) TaxID=192944 RepID=UPI00109E27C6|nr:MULTISPECIES: vitamin K epoxide reductase family protein [unclassified Rhodococcus (in: high G+C Gram-positive bacteria)]QCB52324.1 vitamin K epoxide reductase family protein [Rhodococcus sp. PAMC28705]QCB59506.1 vitamin K epoxide reductase family protein [Rhodococcus sp. PAMC28707]